MSYLADIKWSAGLHNEKTLLRTDRPKQYEKLQHYWLSRETFSLIGKLRASGVWKFWFGALPRHSNAVFAINNAMLLTAPSRGLWSPVSFVFDLLNCKKSWRNKQKRNISVPSCPNIKQSNKLWRSKKTGNGKMENIYRCIFMHKTWASWVWSILLGVRQRDHLSRQIELCAKIELWWCRLSPKTYRHEAFFSPNRLWYFQPNLATSVRLRTPVKASQEDSEQSIPQSDCPLHLENITIFLTNLFAQNGAAKSSYPGNADVYGIVCSRELPLQSPGRVEREQVQNKFFTGFGFSFSPEGSPRWLHQRFEREHRRPERSSERQVRSWRSWSTHSTQHLLLPFGVKHQLLEPEDKSLLRVQDKRETDLGLNLKTHLYRHLIFLKSKYILELLPPSNRWP